MSRKGVAKASRANLIPFVKGKSGNPAGRTKGQRDYATIYREALLKFAKQNKKSEEAIENEILVKALSSARKGDYRFYKDLLDRLYGTPTQTMRTEDKEGNKLPITGIVINNPNDTAGEDTPNKS